MSERAREIEQQWNGEARKMLVGKTIRAVRYMTREESEQFMWTERALIIFFTDGSYMIPQSDDEGNGGGALLIDGNDVLPVLY